MDADGTALGTHDGVMGFTVGQRRGLGVAVGEPRYVVELRTDRREVVLGHKADLEAAGARVDGMTWVVGRPPRSPEGLSAKIRYRAEPSPIDELFEDGGGWRVRFAVPESAVTPGQTLALYRGDEVLGGGIIREAVRQAPGSSSSASSVSPASTAS